MFQRRRHPAKGPHCCPPQMMPMQYDPPQFYHQSNMYAQIISIQLFHTYNLHMLQQ